MKRIIFLIYLISSLNMMAQDYESINGVNVELPYFKYITSMLGKEVAMRDTYKLGDNGHFYSFNGKKYKIIKDWEQQVNIDDIYIVESLDTMKNQIYLNLCSQRTHNMLSFYIPTGFEISNYFINTSADDAFEEYLKVHCKYKDIGHKVKYSFCDQTVTLPYSKYSYDKVYIKEEKGKLPTIMVVWWDRPEPYFSDFEDSYIEYLEKKDEYLSEAQLQEKIRHEAQRVNELFTRIVPNKEKFGINVALALMQLEIEHKEKWWISDSEVFQSIFNRYGDEVTAKIILGEVQIGMDTTACWYAWGSAERENKTTYEWGIKEQWVYPDRDAYLYFTDGILTAIQD